jgi:hypothetical protein
MAVGMGSYTGTGRAKCGMCKKIIPKGENGLEGWAYRNVTKFCRRCVVLLLFELKTSKQIDEVLLMREMMK